MKELREKELFAQLEFEALHSQEPLATRAALRAAYTAGAQAAIKVVEAHIPSASEFVQMALRRVTSGIRSRCAL